MNRDISSKNAVIVEKLLYCAVVLVCIQGKSEDYFVQQVTVVNQGATVTRERARDKPCNDKKLCCFSLPLRIYSQSEFFCTKSKSSGLFSSILGLCWKYIKEKSRLDTQVEVNSNDAIGDLAWCFNKMAEHLESISTLMEKLQQVGEASRESEMMNRLLLEGSSVCNKHAFLSQESVT